MLPQRQAGGAVINKHFMHRRQGGQRRGRLVAIDFIEEYRDRAPAAIAIAESEPPTKWTSAPKRIYGSGDATICSGVFHLSCRVIRSRRQLSDRDFQLQT